MAKKSKITFSSSYSSWRFRIIFAEIDLTTGEEIKRSQQGQPYSDFHYALDFLSVLYYKNYQNSDDSVFVKDNGTIIQITKRKPDKAYVYYIEDAESI